MTSEQSSHPNLRVAICGLGKMGMMHNAMLSIVPHVDVIALVDADMNTCRQVASMGGSPEIFQTLEGCLDKARPDAVWLTTPQFTHRALMQTCLEHNVAVFCEKPLAHSIEDAHAMLEAARHRPDLPVGIGFMLAFNPLFERARDMIEKGAIGKIKSYRASCRLSQAFSPSKEGWTFTKEKAGGGVLINSGCHLLYVLQALFGRPAGLTVRGGPIHNEVEDILAALVDYRSGLWGQLEVTWSVPGYESQSHDVEIIGTGGTLLVTNDLLRLWAPQAGQTQKARTEIIRREELTPRAPFTLSPEYCGDEFYLEDADFIGALREKRAPRVGIDQAYAIQETLHAIYVSMQNKGEYVTVPGEDEA